MYEAKCCILRELSHWRHYLLRKVISFVMEIVLFVSTVVTVLPKKNAVSTYSCFLNELFSLS